MAKIESKCMPSTYVLKLNDGSYYIGSTSNLGRRLLEHKNGKVRSTKNKLPLELVFEKQFETRANAQKFEYQIKKWKSRKAVERLFKINNGLIV